MLGDTAVAVHPDDERYAPPGRHARSSCRSPDRRIPVVADEHVDPEFGTGAVKVTPAHDPNDFEIGQRHDLPSLTVMDERGVITAHGPFQGLDRFEARAAIVAALRAEGRIVAEKRPYVHAVGHCSRCKTTVEPRLSLQWCVKVEPLAKAAGDAVRDGRVDASTRRSWRSRYFDWVDNMHDWCISRQLWWGHRIPVWYGPDGEIVCVGPDDEPPTGEGWTQDPDVLDTWFSSGLWPFSTLGWPEQTADLAKFYPTAVLVTGYDIIFFWVARMMMFGLYAMDGTPPFHTIALHGMVRDEHGKKMSKSFGNVVDPLDWMDALRLRRAALHPRRAAPTPAPTCRSARTGSRASRNFANKIWNATRFALMNGATVEGPLPAAEQLTAADRWILSRLNAVVAEVDALYDDYQFAKLSDALYHFAWDEVFDWYVELSKTTFLAGGEPAEVSGAGPRRGPRRHCCGCCTRSCRSSPRRCGRRSPAASRWSSPTGRPTAASATPAAEREIGTLQQVITEVRRFRADQGLQPGQRVPAGSTLAGTALAAHEAAIRQLLRLQPAGEGFHGHGLAAGRRRQVALDLSGAIDVAAERKRLDQGPGGGREGEGPGDAKLGNEAFLAKAPDHVVDKIRAGSPRPRRTSRGSPPSWPACRRAEPHARADAAPPGRRPRRSAVGGAPARLCDACRGPAPVRRPCPAPARRMSAAPDSVDWPA